ncbi:Glycoside hydrolase family 18 catalytic domain [Trinorchestia longiramus]|nr:Glycoside hydrolase family 18 catalytic domain [Trinorchestia longiramus]
MESLLSSKLSTRIVCAEPTEMLITVVVALAFVSPKSSSDATEVNEYTSYVLRQPLGRALFLDANSLFFQRYQQKKEKDELFAFVLECDSTVWSKFDWVKLTTIVMFNFYDSELLVHAHSNGVKVAKKAEMAGLDFTNATARSEWVAAEVLDVVEKGLDGVNFDFESPMDPESPEQEGYTSLVREMKAALDDAFPESQVSVDVAWSAEGIDGRYYDYAGLAQYSDLLFVMAYDEQSQIWDEPCNARANSPLDNAQAGILSYQALGIESSKLVLGLPWYGYGYNCTEYFPENGTCLIEYVPFRGCNCSDAAGRQYGYDVIMRYIETQNVTELWDDEARSPYFTVTPSLDMTFLEKVSYEGCGREDVHGIVPC